MAQSGTIPMISLILMVLLAVLVPSTMANDETKLEQQQQRGMMEDRRNNMDWCFEFAGGVPYRGFQKPIKTQCTDQYDCGRGGFCNKDRLCQCHPLCRGYYYDNTSSGFSDEGRLIGRPVKCTIPLHTSGRNDGDSGENNAECGLNGRCEKVRDMTDHNCICYRPNAWSTF